MTKTPKAGRAFSQGAKEVKASGARAELATLRRRLAERLRHVIGNPVIEEKELAAFDILMGRREVLKLGGSSLMVAGLVAAGVPPTAWGQREPSLGVHPCEVGLTPEEQASVTLAIQLGIGTELFQQTIYAEPVVSPQASLTHAVIEGARHRYRLQSRLDSIEPAEADFLDNGHHWGPPELVQLEETPNGWELVHYRHPWSAREDGAATDGLIREVIMTAADGLSDPVKVLTISSPYNNLVTDDGMSGAAYVIVVIDNAADASGFLCVGTGTWSMTASTEAPPEYPVQWKSMGLPFVLREVTGSKMWSDDKYVEMGHTDSQHPAEYIPAKSTEHIILYYPNGPRVITLADNGTPGYAYVWVDMLLYPLAGRPTPTSSTTPRLIHMQTNTNVSASGNSPPYRTDWLLFASNIKNSDGSYDFTTVAVGHTGSTQREELDIWTEKGIYGRNQQYDNAYQHASDTTSRAQPPQGQQLDYTQVFNVHAFYGTDDGYWLKLAYFENVGLALFVVYADGTSNYLTGHFPLALPDIDGIGNITTLSGGVSKFDGFRFVASDDQGNLFLLRHRRAFSSSTPYSAPIYGFNDAEGNPRTYYSYYENDPLPDGVDPDSNLHDLDAWMAASNDNQYQVFEARNVLLNAVMAFATDATALSQATWLGNTYQAAYAPRRFPFDSAFIVIQRAQGGGDTDYSAYTMHNNVVTKTWHTRQIATQILPKDPGLNESGDHYHATVTPLNAYGRPVSLLTSDNAKLAIEVRADAPTTVVDDTHNLYYDIDRYTSFMAVPDPASGRLSLVVKADSFSSVLYARLVDTSGLVPSASDQAMLASTETPYPWQSANLAAQAQQRMGNDLNDSLAELGDAAPLADTTQYISGDSLTNASTQGNWDFKGGFQPSTGNSGNLGSLATYLNTSGQTMVGASPQLSLGASPDGVTIDPLTAVTPTALGTDISGGARFAYRAGTVTPATTSALLSQRRRAIDSDLGSIWSSVSHALHDALQWLQNVEADVYNDLAEGAVALVVDAEGITATVSADIMKAVNGVEQELNEVVSTIEEYASVVANVIVTIVEQSFLYKLIEDIIALISLFRHLGDILDLADSLKTRFDAILSGPDLIPDDYSSWEEFQSFFGPVNDLADQMNQLDVSSVPTEVVTDVLDAIAKNPMTGKVMNALLSNISKAIVGELPSPPIAFTPNDAIVNDMIQDLLGLEDNIVNAVINLTDDVIGDAISQMTADMENPQKTYSNLTAGLETLVAQVEVDVLEPILKWADGAVRSAQQTMQEVIDQDPLITVDLTLLKDLLSLFKIGQKVNDTYTVSAADAVFIPMAIVMWEALYTTTGKSISSIDDLQSTSPSSLPNPFALSDAQTDLAIANLAVNCVVTEFGAGIWAFTAIAKVEGADSPPDLGLQRDANAWLKVIRRISNIVQYMEQNVGPGFSIADNKIPGLVNVWMQLLLSGYGLYTQLSSKNVGKGWPDNPKPSDALRLIGVLATVGMTAKDVVQLLSGQPSNSDIWSVTGSSIGRSQSVATFIWDKLLETSDEIFPLYAGYVFLAPLGWILQSVAIAGDLGALGNGVGSCPRNRGIRKGQS